MWVQQLRDDLQGKVAAGRVAGQDKLRWARACVKEVLDGCEGLAQLFWEGIFRHESCVWGSVGYDIRRQDRVEVHRN